MESVSKPNYICRTCDTIHETVSGFYTWKIPRFTRHFAGGFGNSLISRPESSEFTQTVGKKVLCQFELELKPETSNVGLLNRGEQSVWVNLSLYESLKAESISFSILDAEGTKLRTKKFTNLLLEPNKKRHFKIVAHQRELFMDSRLIPNDTLTIHCELTAVRVAHNSGSENETTLTNDFPEFRLGVDMATLMDSEFYDAVVLAGGREFKVYKGILAARSPVFQAMFHHPLRESKQNRVEIKDIRAQVFEEMLRFMYTGAISSLDGGIALELLVASDKYDLGQLNKICETHILNSLSVANASGVLVFLEEHAVDSLKSGVIKFIAQNIKQVLQTDEWKVKVRQRPTLMEEIMVTVVESCEEPASKKRKTV